MTRFVLDCSMTMAWWLEDEANERADAILASLKTHQVVVPGHWPLEVANVLTLSERRGRLSAQRIMQIIQLLDRLSVAIDDQTVKYAFGDTLSLARTHRLTIYDAAYLELALRTGYPLASLDAPLNKVATRLGIALFDG